MQELDEFVAVEQIDYDLADLILMDAKASNCEPYRQRTAEHVARHRLTALRAQVNQQSCSDAEPCSDPACRMVGPHNFCMPKNPAQAVAADGELQCDRDAAERFFEGGFQLGVTGYKRLCRILIEHRLAAVKGEKV